MYISQCSVEYVCTLLGIDIISNTFYMNISTIRGMLSVDTGYCTVPIISIALQTL